jgi:probable addiction module antidote protein
MIAKQSIRSSRTSRRAITERINAAFETGDIAEICHAIEIGTRQHNVADLARRAGINRISLYRAFSGSEKHPNFSTVLNVLHAVGLQLHVTMRQSVEPQKTNRDPSRMSVRPACALAWPPCSPVELVRCAAFLRPPMPCRPVARRDDEMRSTLSCRLCCLRPVVTLLPPWRRWR